MGVVTRCSALPSCYPQRSSVVFEGIPRRRPVLLTGARPERMDFCDRIITVRIW